MTYVFKWIIEGLNDMLLHSTSVEISGKGLIILGKSGSGKSNLAIDLISLGAKLIADDQTRLEKRGEKVFACTPTELPPLLEARGIGLLAPPIAKATPIACIVNMSERSLKRIPNNIKTRILLGVSFQEYLIGGIDNPSGSIFLLMRYGAVDQDMAIEDLKDVDRLNNDKEKRT